MRRSGRRRAPASGRSRRRWPRARATRPSDTRSCPAARRPRAARRSAAAPRVAARAAALALTGMRAEPAARPAAARRPARRRRRRRASRCSGRSAGGSGRTGRPALIDCRSSSQPIVGCRYGCARNAVAVTSVSSSCSGSFSPPCSSEMMTVRSDSHVGRLVEAVGHPLGLDEQHLVERVPAGRLEVCRLVDPRVAVPHPAEPLDDALHLVARDVGRALEVHVLDPVRHAGAAGHFVARADAIPAPHRHERRGVHRVHEHLAGRCRVSSGAPSDGLTGASKAGISSIILAGFLAYFGRNSNKKGYC